MYPFVSVVIPAFNEQGSIARAIGSLQQQDYPNFEIIVVDNGSADNTGAIAERLGVRVVREPRKGVSFARQAGFTAAKGVFICTTDADTSVPFDWISQLVAVFQTDPGIAAVGGLYTLTSGTPISRMVIRHGSSALWRIDRLLNGGWSLAGPNMAVRKSAFMAVGGFDTALAVCEDADLSQRLAKVGTVILLTKMKVATSGRRYAKGLLPAVMFYLPHLRYQRFPSLRRFFAKRQREFSAIRSEN